MDALTALVDWQAVYKAGIIALSTGSFFYSAWETGLTYRRENIWYRAMNSMGAGILGAALTFVPALTWPITLPFFIMFWYQDFKYNNLRV